MLLNILAYVHIRNIYNSTGAGRVARNIIEALDRDGDNEIKILGERADHNNIIPKIGTPWSGFDYRLFDADTSLQQRRWILLNRPKADNYWPEAEIVYCAGEAYVPTRKARSVNLIHDAAYFEASAHRKNKNYYTQQIRWRMLFGRIASSADMIHTVSQFSADRLEHYFPAFKGRIQVVHNAVSEIFFSDERRDDAAILAKWDLASRPYVLLPRGLSFRKNADLVLDTWPKILSLHPEARLVVTSHNDPDYVARTQALRPDVITTGFVSDEELRALYRAARLVWFPSRYEGFGLPVLEAMACGTPVVASDVASLPEIMGDAGILVPPDEPDRHLEAIDYLLCDVGARAYFIQRGEQHSRKFTWDNSAAILRSAFQSLL